MQSKTPFLFSGNREEISNVTLEPIFGKIPTDIYGHVFLMTQCGTVNSGGYPFPKEIDGKPNPEYGSPVLNGNGMIFSFDLSTPGTVKASSKIVKPPSYYADEATRIDGPARSEAAFKDFHFNNSGIARMSFLLGSVNYANTAIIPVNFDNDSGPSILATYDTGRPIKIDPSSLEFITPIGYNREWVPGVPPFLRAPFPMIETTAHPSWDPVEKVLYAVNFSKSMETELSRTFLYELLRRDKANIVAEIKEIARAFKKDMASGDEKQAKEKAIADIQHIIEKRDVKKSAVRTKKKKARKKPGFFSKILLWFLKLVEWIAKKETQTEDAVYLIKFDGKSALQRWKLVDEKGKSLVIYQCMHQTSISENYIILMDSSFKFAFDLLINNPVPGDQFVDELIRVLSAKTILPSTRLWIINKKDLGPNETIVARSVQGQPIPGLTNEPYGGVPMECVHFSTDYDDSNDQITIYTAHNNSTCLAEWIRPYDFNFFTNQPYDEGNISNYAAGQLSLSSIGKYVIDGQKAAFVPNESKVIKEKGNLPPVNQLPDGPIMNVGPNTWGIGLYAYRGMISPTDPGSKIKQLYFVSFGTQPELLTSFIHGLYEDQDKNRTLPLKDFLAYTKCGIPQSLVSVNTDTMEIVDHYEFKWGIFPMSIQFLPLKQNTPGRPPEQDGYIWVTTKNLIEKGGEKEFVSQLWLFEGWNLANGPACILASPDFNFCTSLHITWIEEAKAVESGYKIDIRKDFSESIDNSFLEIIEKKTYEDFFEKYVYPPFSNP